MKCEHFSLEWIFCKKKSEDQLGIIERKYFLVKKSVKIKTNRCVPNMFKGNRLFFGGKIEAVVRMVKIKLYKKTQFRQTIEILVKNQNFGQKSKFWSKIEMLVKNQNFGQKSNFPSKIKILVKNQTFVQKSKFWSKIKLSFKNQILVKNQTFVQKSKFWSRNNFG